MDEINKYRSLLKKAFFINEEIEEGHDKSIIKDYLKTGYVQKIQYLEIWSDFITALRRKKNFRIRDISGAGDLHSFVGILSYEPKGIIFSISFPFKLYGFYYALFTEIKGTERYDQHQAYEPFDEDMESCARWIESVIKQYFKGFRRFNNAFADNKIERIVIGHRLYTNLDFWKALLSSYSDGII